MAHTHPRYASLAPALLLTVFLLGMPGVGLAQDDERAPLSTPMKRFRPLLHRELLIYRPRGHSTPLDHTVRAMLGAPLWRGEALTLDVLLEYQYDVLSGPVIDSLEGLPVDVSDGLSLHRFELAFPAHITLSDDWALEFGVRAIYSGDLETHDASAWWGLLRASATWRFDRDWAFLFGLASARIEPVGVLPVPLLGVYYRPTGGPWQFDALVPTRVEVRWWPSKAIPDLHLLALTELRSVDWHARQRARMSRLRLDLAIGLRWGLYWPIEFELKVGSNLMQRIALRPDEGRPYEQRDWLDGPTFSASAGFVVRTDL